MVGSGCKRKYFYALHRRNLFLTRQGAGEIARHTAGIHRRLPITLGMKGVFNMARGGGFPRGMGGGGMGNMQQMMKQAQKMQENIGRVQAEVEEREVTASSGGGVVTAVVNGKKELKSITIKPEAVDPDDVEMLQDLVLAAVNQALKDADEMMQAEMAKVTGGLNLGGLF